MTTSYTIDVNQHVQVLES